MLLALAAGACRGDPPDTPALSLRADAPRLLGTEHAGRADSALQLPAHLRLDPGGWIYTLETGRPSVVGYRESDAVQRIVGRPGRGPGEMSGPAFMDISPSGRMWVADHGNAKMVAYQDGQLWGEFLVDHSPTGVVAVGDSQVWVGGDLQHSVMVRYDVTGKKLGTVGVPPDTSRWAFRLNQGSVAAGTGPCTAVWAYRFRSRVDCFGPDGSTVWSVRGPVPVTPDRHTHPFRMRESDRFAYTDVAVHGDRVYALFMGGPVGHSALRTDRAHVFAMRDGRFLGTLRLPHPAKALVRSDTLLGLLEYEPEPHILLYRIREEP
jgi:hypothetical protein